MQTRCQPTLHSLCHPKLIKQLPSSWAPQFRNTFTAGWGLHTHKEPGGISYVYLEGNSFPWMTLVEKKREGSSTKSLQLNPILSEH